MIITEKTTDLRAWSMHVTFKGQGTQRNGAYYGETNISIKNISACTLLKNNKIAVVVKAFYGKVATTRILFKGN